MSEEDKEQIWMWIYGAVFGGCIVVLYNLGRGI